MIEAKVITDSVGTHSPRLTTFLTRYPKFVHAEHCRHRTHSFCVSSSRAIPLKRTLEEVRSDALRAVPAFWGSEQRGMSPGEELFGDALLDAQEMWRTAALHAADFAEALSEGNHPIHKSICNRLLDPFLHVNVLVTSCEPGLLNFFGLRLDQAADPTIRALAEAMWAAWGGSEPQKLEPGQWHLPFIDLETLDQIWPDEWSGKGGKGEEGLRCVSAARCARLSYTSFETGRRSTIEEDLALYDRLLGAQPIHASPAEHQATPDQRVNDENIVYASHGDYTMWDKPHLHGNLSGWVQHRKLLPNEAAAPLPEGYMR